jgi:hypothetical protein
VQLDSEGLRSLAFGFQRRAWRLELHQVYTIESEKEDLAAYLRGEPAPEDYPWRDFVEKSTKEGKSMGRVRVVWRPFTPYTRFQFDWGYALTVPVGEDVRVLDLSIAADPGLPQNDFWLFDDTVVRMLYDSQGVHLGQEIVDGTEALEEYERYRELAIKHSVPFEQYWPENARAA